MRVWLDPWPAIADLYSALMVAFFVGFIAFTGSQHDPKERVNIEAQLRLRLVREALQKELGEIASVRECGADTCLDVRIFFEEADDEVLPEFKSRLGNACLAVREAMEDPTARNETEIFIEGHADQQQARNVMEPRARYRFNWDLSTRRATSVLFEFAECGVKHPEYRILATGYADTAPVCVERTPDCYAKNRRITFRLRADKEEIERRLRRY